MGRRKYMGAKGAKGGTERPAPTAPVPMGTGLYPAAATVIDQVLRKEGLPRALSLRSPFSGKKQLLALVTQTLRFLPVLDQIVDNSKILTVERRLPRSLALVVAHDVAIAECGVQCGGLPRRLEQRHKARLKAELARLKARAQVRHAKDLLSEESRADIRLPRWVRVNTIRSQVDAAVQRIQKQGFKLVTVTDQSSVMSLAPGTFARDPHLPDVLAFAPGTDLHESPLYGLGMSLYTCVCARIYAYACVCTHWSERKMASLCIRFVRQTYIHSFRVSDMCRYLDGSLILQDKASCMPAHAVGPPPGATCIDACAAPGNKTSHLAALMGNKGKIIAFDTDARRLNLLRRLTTKAGATCIEARHGSFLDVNTSAPDVAMVTHLLVDPSCSGSGMMATPWTEAEQSQSADGASVDMDRIQQLADFQVQCIVKAMSFPAAQRISYSTCSIHETENEAVVARALAQRPDFMVVSALPQWPRRGINPPTSSTVSTSTTPASPMAAAASTASARTIAPPATAPASSGSVTSGPASSGKRRKYDTHPVGSNTTNAGGVYPFAPLVLRADRTLDGTTGFFVAVFERRSTNLALDSTVHHGATAGQSDSVNTHALSVPSSSAVAKGDPQHGERKGTTPTGTGEGNGTLSEIRKRKKKNKKTSKHKKSGKAVTTTL
eukprot:m.113646 g.113646  ORF g.113646 m.113646 type:complete len:665 (+) comp10811_c0_seq4:214-2208(+)